jgi:euchromatic histone-lysine N-methyltransferase
VEAYASHTSGAERIGNRWHCEERRSSAVPTTIDSNMTNKPGGSLCNVVAAESLAQGLSKGHRSESVSECAALDTTSSDFAAGVSGEGALMRKKVMHTARKSVRTPRLIQKSLLNTQCRPFSKEIDRETELGWSVTMNDIEDTGVFIKDGAIQDPMSANKSPWTNGKEAAFFGPKKRVSKKKLMNKRRVTVKGPTQCFKSPAKTF